MRNFKAASGRVRMYAEILREMAGYLDEESGELLEQAASVADQVEATTRPGDWKDAAAEIGKRIRALMEEGR